MNFDNKVLTTTQAKLMPKIIDTVTNGNVLLYRLFNNPNRTTFMGEKLEVPVKYQTSSQGGAFSAYDTFNTAAENNRVKAEYRVFGYEQPVVLSGMEISANETEMGQIRLITAQMQESAIDMLSGIGDLLYSDGSNGNEFIGLKAAVDDGNNTATYANLSRSTYTDWTSSVTNVNGDLTLTHMASAFNAACHGGQTPTIIVTDKATWSYYEELLTPTVRANYNSAGYPVIGASGGLQTPGSLGGAQGFTALSYRGIPVVWDEKCPTGYMYFLNENYIYWAGLDDKMPMMQSQSMGDNSTVDTAGAPASNIPGFSFTGWIQPSNQHAIIGHLILMGNIICTNPRTQSVLYGITGA